MQIQRKLLSELTPADYNPRSITDAALKGLRASIQRFGLVEPIIWNERTGNVVGGHQRLKVLLADGEVQTDVVVVDLPETEEKALNIALNNPAIAGDFTADIKLLIDELKIEIPEAVIDLRLDQLIDDIGRKQGHAQPIEDVFVPDSPAEPRSKRGEVYSLGNHRLMCGDATDPGDVLLLTENSPVDVVVFDPPYDVDELYSAIPAYQNGQRLILFWDLKRFGIAPYSAMNAGWEPSYELIWDGVTSWYTPGRPLARHKSVGLFGVDKWNWDGAIIHDGKSRQAKTVSNTRGACDYVPLDGAKHLSSLEQFPNTAQSDEHKHGKPIPWIAAIFNGVGGNAYLDLFAGSGTTMIVCEQQGRKSYNMELDPACCDVIIERWESLTGYQAELIN